ncbi:YbaB/EbfC family nucleoid-associated protein [Halocola ammonii]
MFQDALKKMQAQVEESKKRLESVIVEGKSEGVVVEMTGNRKVRDIKIDDELMDDKDSLQDLLLVATNRALEEAEKVYEAEMASSAQNIMPNFPGM